MLIIRYLYRDSYNSIYLLGACMATICLSAGVWSWAVVLLVGTFVANVLISATIRTIDDHRLPKPNHPKGNPMTVAELIQKLQQYPADAKLDSLTNPAWAKGKTVVFVEGSELDPLFQIKDQKEATQ